MWNAFQAHLSESPSVSGSARPADAIMHSKRDIQIQFICSRIHILFCFKYIYMMLNVSSMGMVSKLAYKLCRSLSVLLLYLFFCFVAEPQRNHNEDTQSYIIRVYKCLPIYCVWLSFFFVRGLRFANRFSSSVFFCR